MKQEKIKKLKGLKQFAYYDVSSTFDLSVSSNLDYFKNKINKNVNWNSKLIDLSSTPNTPAFDSGIVCAEHSSFPSKTSEISSLKCFFAPYKFMQDTIGTIKKPCKKKENPNSDNLAIGIGMILSIIATKGSAESGNKTPYIVFIKRGDLSIRGNELDVPVVEGLNCSDFKLNNSGTKYIANLSDIAKRALEEERGLNVAFLTSKDLLHMPSKYYLGYDASYCQWNFFGTVVIDCTIEEIIREGCYYTKDKFETKEIIGIPAEPRILYYYLSDKMIPIHNRNREKEKTDMWITAWASVMFAMRDYYEEKSYKRHEKKCLRRRKFRWFFNGNVRKVLNNIAAFLVEHKYAFELSCALLALLLITLLLAVPIIRAYFGINQCVESILNFAKEIASTITTVLASWIVIAVIRHDIVYRKDIIKLNTYWQDSKEQSTMFPEISVFQNVLLKDGNIAENLRNVNFRYQYTRDLNGTISSQRQCQIAYTQTAGKKAWGIKDFTKENVENFSWVIKCCSKTKNAIRLVAPLIIKNRGIVFYKESGTISHRIDFEIPYTAFVGKSDNQIKRILIKEINKHLCVLYRCNVNIKFRFLLEHGGQSVIVAFIESNIPSSQARPLTYDLTETTFSQTMKDDITRVACEYAIAEYVGYKMSNR